MIALIKKIRNYSLKFFINFLDKLAIRSASVMFDDLPSLDKPYFIIVTPGSLHIVELCIKFIPDNIDIVLILNGLDKWEREFISKRFQVKGVIPLNPLDQRMIVHGKILDLIFDNFLEPFGILDYDCFIFNPIFFEKIEHLKDDAIVNATFIKTGGLIETPQTFFLYFNTTLVNAIRDKYKVSCDEVQISKLSSTIINQLALIGIDDEHYLDGRDFFDTLHLLFALAISEGYTCNFIEKISGKTKLSDEVFHVGGVTIRNRLHKDDLNEIWKIKRSYFWYHTLAETKDDDLKNRYYRLYGYKNTDDILNSIQNAKEKIGENFFHIVEQIIDN